MLNHFVDFDGLLEKEQLGSGSGTAFFMVVTALPKGRITVKMNQTITNFCLGSGKHVRFLRIHT